MRSLAPGKIAEDNRRYARAYRARNLELCRQKSREWAAENRLLLAAHTRTRKRSNWSNALSYMVHGCKSRARRKGLELTLDDAWIRATAARLEADPYCSVSSCLMTPGMKKYRGGAHPSTPSLDRIDPRKGYTPDNVRVVCMFVNVAKGNLDDDEFGEWVLATAESIRGKSGETI